MSEPELLGPASHTYISQRLRLHYVDWGNPDAPSLLLVHGGRDHGRSWDWVAQELRKDWHVIAPDLRGHGDSAWAPDGSYVMAGHLYDLAQLIHQQRLEPVTIIAHSLGGSISLRYAGIYPEQVRKLVVVEGVAHVPEAVLEAAAQPLHVRWRQWIENRRLLSARPPHRYPTLEDALARMMAENAHLSVEQARHLTVHGASRNEDGTYSWKFDNYVRSRPPADLSPEELHALWGRIACPMLLCWGRKSWALDPSDEAKHFADARVAAFDDAGHWLHHDQFDAFMSEVRAFI